MHSVKKRTNKLNFFLISVIIITLVVVASVFLGYRKTLDKNEKLKTASKGEANVTMGRVNHSATREGRKEWTLDAKSARLIDEKKQLILDDLSVIFFIKNGGKIYLTAEKGFLHTESNNIEVVGDVVVKNNIYTLKAKKINYNHKERMLFSDVPVKISGNSSVIIADSMSVNLITKRALFEGNVKGTFSENIEL